MITNTTGATIRTGGMQGGSSGMTMAGTAGIAAAPVNSLEQAIHVNQGANHDLAQERWPAASAASQRHSWGCS